MFKSTKSAVTATERPIIGILTQSLLSTLKTDYPWASSYLASRSVLTLSTKNYSKQNQLTLLSCWISSLDFPIFRFIGLEEKNPDREIGETAFLTVFQPWIHLVIMLNELRQHGSLHAELANMQPCLKHQHSFAMISKCHQLVRTNRTNPLDKPYFFRHPCAIQSLYCCPLKIPTSVRILTQYIQLCQVHRVCWREGRPHTSRPERGVLQTDVCVDQRPPHPGRERDFRFFK